MRKVWSLPGFWLLMAANLFILIYYIEDPDSIHTVIALFYIQSVMIGVFNALDLFTLRNAEENSFTINDKPGNRQGCAGLFFLVHYGMFHFVYLLFLPGIIEFSLIDWSFLRISFWLLLASSIVDFMYNKRRQRFQQANISSLWFMPYARIVPMHLLILAPKFFHISASMLFITLKVIADIIMFVVYQNAVYKDSKTTPTFPGTEAKQN